MPGCGVGAPGMPSGQNSGPNQTNGNNCTDGGSPSCPKPCYHPVNPNLTLVQANLAFGLIVQLTWQSPTGNPNDLNPCKVTEQLTFSKIPCPPFGYPDLGDAGVLAESGTTVRRGSNGTDVPVPGSACKFQDKHQCPRAAVPPPPTVAGSYTVNQSYDYKCSICGAGWVSFATCVITYKLYQDSQGQWRFNTQVAGPGSPPPSDESYL
jgi:hypothetical protein